VFVEHPTPSPETVVIGPQAEPLSMTRQRTKVGFMPCGQPLRRCDPISLAGILKPLTAAAFVHYRTALDGQEYADEKDVLSSNYCDRWR
jgi:hypothetical protein